MEVTPHLKTVLKNYQHSATKSLHGPGLSLVNNVKCESLSPDSKEDDFLQHTPLPIQQFPPILTIADTTCSDRTETILEGENISCFVVGGEKRLCLPQVLNSVLRDFLLSQIHQECDQLQIYCSQCTLEQLNVLKTHGILPSTAPTCGLITKTDAERLCSALLHNQVTVPIPTIKGALSFRIYHECFGKCMGLCTPALYTSKDARCIECLECHGAYTPQQFVCHVHRNLENRTVHWGFDSSLWRSYMYICKDQIDHEQYTKYLDEMRDQYEGKISFPTPVTDNRVNNLKRKQILHHGSDIIKLEDTPHKKHKMDDYPQLPYGLDILQPLYIQYFQDQYLTNNRHISAFKPPLISHSTKDISKIRHTMRYAEPPILQHPERVVPHSKSESFEGNYQPNVALAPSTKKHRYLKQETTHLDDKEMVPSNEVSSTKESLIPKGTSVIRHEKYIEHSPKKSPDSQNIIDSTVSVVQSTGNLGRYNSEIELSTDTDDSGSETSEKPGIYKMEEIMKDVDIVIKEKVLEMFKNICKQHQQLQQENRSKDNEITELTNVVTTLKQQLMDLRSNQNNLNVLSNDYTENSVNVIEKTKDRASTPMNENVNIVTTSSDNQSSIIENNQPQLSDCGEDNTSSSNEISLKESKDIELVQSTSVIASTDDQEKMINKTAPE
ncbi:putative smad binding protein [Trypoxylus dichotomus]